MANLLAENMYSQVDEEGQQYTLMSEIIDHKSNGKALSKDLGFYLDCYGKPTTKNDNTWLEIVSGMERQKF